MGGEGIRLDLHPTCPFSAPTFRLYPNFIETPLYWSF